MLVRRGDREVVRNVADNQSGAGCRRRGFSTLVERADGDGVLAEKVGAAPGHSAASVPRAADAGDRGGAAAPAGGGQAARRRPRSARARQGRPRNSASRAGARLRRARSARCSALHQTGKLNEAELAEFANGKQYEETVAALSVLCAVPIEVVDRLMSGERPIRC